MLVGEEDEVFEAAPGIPGGKIAEWLPVEISYSKQRADRSNASDLAKHLYIPDLKIDFCRTSCGS